MKNTNVLVDEMLFEDNISGSYFEYCPLPDAVGVASVKCSSKSYYVYENDEHGNLEWFIKEDCLSEAINQARETYKGLKSYYEGISGDFARINKKTN